MKTLLPLVLFLSCLHCLAADSFLLDDVMPRDEQKKTGVNTLTPAQKVELEQWLNTTFTLKNQIQKQVNPLSMSINIDNGQKLQLSDNSVWEIAPSDVKRASLWIVPFPITLGASKDPTYPILIINTVSGDSVRARRFTLDQTNGASGGASGTTSP